MEFTYKQYSNAPTIDAINKFYKLENISPINITLYPRRYNNISYNRRWYNSSSSSARYSYNQTLREINARTVRIRPTDRLHVLSFSRRDKPFCSRTYYGRNNVVVTSTTIWSTRTVIHAYWRLAKTVRHSRRTSTFFLSFLRVITCTYIHTWGTVIVVHTRTVVGKRTRRVGYRTVVLYVLWSEIIRYKKKTKKKQNGISHTFYSEFWIFRF